MKKIILTTGGTGGHIFPMISLYQKLKEDSRVNEIRIITDDRAKKYIDIKKIKIIKSDSPFRKKGIFHFFKCLILVFFSTIYCLIFLSIFRPSIVVGSGGYVSLPVLLGALILRKKFVLYETNAVLGRVNKLFLPFCIKLFSGYPDIKGFPIKYKKKFIHVGQLVRDDFIIFSHENISIEKEKYNNDSKIFNVLILGGSQGAKVFGEKLPKCFKILSDESFKLSIHQQIQKNQIDILKEFYKNQNNIFVELFEFKKNIKDYINNADVVICRSGSSTLSELVFLNKPFIAIPFPSSLDNHQYYNAQYYEKNNCCWILDENAHDFESKIINILKDIYNSKSILEQKKNNLSNIKKINSNKNFIVELFKQ